MKYSSSPPLPMRQPVRTEMHGSPLLPGGLGVVPIYFYTRLFGEDYYIFREAVAMVFDRMNDPPYCDKSEFLEWLIGPLWYNCHEYDVVDKVLKVYVNLVLAGQIPEYTTPSDVATGARIYDSVARGAGVTSKVAGYMLKELYNLTRTGPVRSTSVIYPRSYAEREQLRQTPDPFEPELPGTGVSFDTALDWLKLLLLLGVVAGVGYVGFQVYREVKG
jgi:hypothetical protein